MFYDFTGTGYLRRLVILVQVLCRTSNFCIQNQVSTKYVGGKMKALI
jgi:hypothetical protein